MARFNIESNIQEQTGLFQQFGGVLGGLPSIFATVRGAVTALTAAIAANPIGALLTVISAGVVAVTAALSQLQPVIDEINVRLAQLGAAWQFVVDTVGSYLGIAEAPPRTFRETVIAAGELERATQDLDDAQNDFIVTQARLNAAISEQRLIAADATASEAERIAALEEAQRLTNQLYDEEQTLLRERVRILQEQQDLGENTRADNEELNRLQADLINLDTARNNALRETVSMLSALRNAQMAANETTEESTELTREQIRAQEEAARAAMRRADIEAMFSQMAADAVIEAEYAKSDAATDSAQIITEGLFGLLGDSKGIQIAGLIASQAFEAAGIITTGARAAAQAQATAAALATATFGASVAALPAQLSAIAAATTGGLAVLGAQTAVGIAGILAAPGPSPDGAAGGGGAQGFVGGPTVSTPQVESTAPSTDAQAVMSQMAQQQTSVVAVIADGEVARDQERNARLQRRRRLGN